MTKHTFEIVSWAILLAITTIALILAGSWADTNPRDTGATIPSYIHQPQREKSGNQ